jgi:hypothetical protein
LRQYSFSIKLQSQIVCGSAKKLRKTVSYKKAARKMLMKLTPDKLLSDDDAAETAAEAAAAEIAAATAIKAVRLLSAVAEAMLPLPTLVKGGIEFANGEVIDSR